MTAEGESYRTLSPQRIGALIEGLPALRAAASAAYPRLQYVGEADEGAVCDIPAELLEAPERLAARLAELWTEGGEAIELTVEGLGRLRLESAGTRAAGRRLTGRIALVTGAAQGFGEGIARELAAEGARVAIADLNLTRAQAVAAELCDAYGPDAAVAIHVDISDEASVDAMLAQLVLYYGGLDLLVANAGVLRAGGLRS